MNKLAVTAEHIGHLGENVYYLFVANGKAIEHALISELECIAESFGMTVDLAEFPSSDIMSLGSWKHLLRSMFLDHRCDSGFGGGML